VAVLAARDIAFDAARPAPRPYRTEAFGKIRTSSVKDSIPNTASVSSSLMRVAPIFIAAPTAGPATGSPIAPILSTSRRATSPLLRKLGGCKLTPTPSGVPVAIRSPGSSVKAVE